MIRKLVQAAIVAAAISAAPAMAQNAAQQVPVADSADTAWVLVATLLVIIGAVPGLALFYGGQVRARNFLSVVLQCGTVAAIASTAWIIIGYSMAFSAGGGDYVGSVQNFMFNHMLDQMVADQSIAELAFAFFGVGGAILAPMLIVGALAERVRFGWLALFSLFWSLLYYAPAARWIWGGGFLENQGVADLAGGTVIFTGAGISALVAALMLGKRTETTESPNNPALALAGAALAWVGLVALSGGSTGSAGGEDAAWPLINAHLAACIGALTWMLIDRIKGGRVGALGLAYGALTGLAAISAGADIIGPGGAVIVAAVSTALAYAASGIVRKTLGIDDVSNVFAVFGVGGIAGSLLLAVFVSKGLGGLGYEDNASMASQIWLQVKAIAIVGVWSAVVTLIIGYAISMVLPMRVPAEQEAEGLDASSHGVKA